MLQYWEAGGSRERELPARPDRRSPIFHAHEALGYGSLRRVREHGGFSRVGVPYPTRARRYATVQWAGFLGQKIFAGGWGRERTGREAPGSVATGIRERVRDTRLGGSLTFPG